MIHLRRLMILNMLLLSFGSVVIGQDLPAFFRDRVLKIQQKYVPDASLNILSANLENRYGKWILSGETTVPEAGEQVIKLADSLLAGSTYDNQFVMLPHPALGDSSWAIVSVSTAQLRSEPKHAAEMLDQVIMGHSLRLLKKQHMWYQAQTEYGYIGWITGYSLQRTTLQGLDEWRNSRRVIVTALVSSIWSESDEDSEPVNDAVFNMTLKELKRGWSWTKVETPDHRIGFMENEDIARLQPAKQFTEVRREDIIRTARRLMGIPYLWGGNSAKGCDCSGFTQTVFRANGLQLLRDARQQVLAGDEIMPQPDFSNILPGDLLFFGTGERITHVGISLGGYLFIHQDSDVHINSFEETADNYNAFRKKTLKKIKRVLSK